MEEYVKLSRYDGEMVDQGLKGGHRLFLCHQQDGCLCGGWLAAHGPENLLALHMCAVHPTAHDYKTDVPVFSSGAEAAVHGMAEIESPSLRARQMMAAIVTKRGRRDR